MIGDFEQIKTGQNNYDTITNDIIERIARIDAFRDSRMNNLMYEFHKQLLRIAQKHKDKEIGLFWDLKNVEKKPIVVIGERNGINIRQNENVNYLVRNSATCMNVVVMHNHPRNGLFSSRDIQSFIDFNSVYIMTAVCNDGTIYMLRKEHNFNPLLMQKYYSEGAERSYKEALREKLNKAKRIGVDIKNPNEMSKIMNIQTKPYYYGTKNVAKHAKEIGITYRCSVKRKEK